MCCMLWLAIDAHPAEEYALCARPFKKPELVRIMIPTTSGTGTEVTRTATFTNHAGHKVWTWGQELVPDLVILDPCLTVSLPAQVTAATGLDALVHAIEACTCRQRNTISDALGLHAIRLISEHLVTAIQTPDDLNARSGMQIASTRYPPSSSLLPFPSGVSAPEPLSSFPFESPGTAEGR